MNVDCCVLKDCVDDMSDTDVQMEAERIVVETFVCQQQTDITSHSDVLVLDSDGANSRTCSLKKSQKKAVKQRFSDNLLCPNLAILTFMQFAVFNHTLI